MAAEDFIPLFPNKTRRGVELELLAVTAALTWAAVRILRDASREATDAAVEALAIELLVAATQALAQEAAAAAERIAAAKEAHDGR